MTRMSTSLSFLATALALAACGDERALDLTSAPLVYMDTAAACKALYAGQSIDVGTVCLSVDNEADTSGTCGEGARGELMVTYTTRDGWSLVETHTAVGTSLLDIPTNKSGNPQPGQFPYHGSALGGVTSYVERVPLCEVALDGAMTSCNPVTAFFAAHAVVQRVRDDGSVQAETAWGDGERFVRKGSWAEYFTVDLMCRADSTQPDDKFGSETAWGYDAGRATTFISLGAATRWGWTNGPYGPGSYVLELYAGAGQNDLSKGTLVGHVDVDYDGARAVVTYRMLPGTEFALVETHLHVGSGVLPMKGGQLTAAPGQFESIHENLGGSVSDRFTVTGLSGLVHVAAHAVVRSKTFVCSGSGCQ